MRKSAGIGKQARKEKDMGLLGLAEARKKGAIPRGMVVMHKCDNRLCCNPNHLEVGTIADNNHDAIAKGRNAKGERNGNSKLTELQVREIRAKHKLGEYTVSQLAKLYKVSESNMRSIVAEEHWKLPLAG